MNYDLFMNFLKSQNCSLSLSSELFDWTILLTRKTNRSLM